jgi:hypothetical protein
LRPDAIVTGDPRNIKPSIEQLKALRPRFVLVILPAGKIPLYRKLFRASFLFRQADVFMKTADVFMKIADGFLKTADRLLKTEVFLNERSRKGELIWVLANSMSSWEVTSFKGERIPCTILSLNVYRKVGSLVCLSLRDWRNLLQVRNLETTPQRTQLNASSCHKVILGGGELGSRNKAFLTVQQKYPVCLFLNRCCASAAVLFCILGREKGES